MNTLVYMAAVFRSNISFIFTRENEDCVSVKWVLKAKRVRHVSSAEAFDSFKPQHSLSSIWL